MDEEPTIKVSPQSGKRSRQYVQGYMAQHPQSRRLADEPTVPMASASKKPKGRRARPLLIALAVFLLFILSGGGVLAYVYYTRVHEPLTQFIHPVARGSDETGTGNYADISGRAWNILLMGSDNDGKYNFPAVLTQVMMIIHVDPINNSVTMVSIPRDSWVWVPEMNGMYKVSQAFFLGASSSDKFDDGVRLARLTIEKDYGITIDRYGWVGLDGFAKVIDTLGGVDVDVTHPMIDDVYPDDVGHSADPNNPFAYKRLYFAPGPQHLTGEEALEYVRTRHSDLVGDIGRTQRQQQILQALKQKLTVKSIMDHLSDIFKDLQGEVYTDLSEQEMLEFANFGRSLNANAIQRVTLGPGNGDQDYGQYATVAGQDVIIPNCDTIQPTINSIFGLGNAASCDVTGAQQTGF
jgi:LCP family protein required for cell wall assembly